MSPLVPDPVIVTALQDCGLASNSGMGDSPLAWSELKAYSELSGAELNQWEALQVINMSKAYCNMKALATRERQTKPPYNPKEELTEQHIYNRGLHASKQADQALDINNY